MLPWGTRPSSSWTLSQSSGTKGSVQASGRSGRQPSRAGAEHAVVVDADDGADPDALAPLQLGEGAIEIGAGEALLGEHGLSLRAVEAVQPIPARPRLADHGGPLTRSSPGLGSPGPSPVIR